MKKVLGALFALLFVFKFCASCSDGNNSDYDRDATSDTTKPPLTDTLGKDTVYIDTKQ